MVQYDAQSALVVASNVAFVAAFIAAVVAWAWQWQGGARVATVAVVVLVVAVSWVAIAKLGMAAVDQAIANAQMRAARGVARAEDGRDPKHDGVGNRVMYRFGGWLPAGVGILVALPVCIVARVIAERRRCEPRYPAAV